MDLFNRSFLNNYTASIANKKEFDNFLFDIKNHILILEENDKKNLELLKQIKQLAASCYGTLLSIIIYLVFFS